MRRTRPFTLGFAVVLSLVALQGTAPAPPEPPPEIYFVSPSEVDVFLGGVVSVHGLHFQYLSYVDVGGIPFYSWQLTTHTDTLIEFSIPIGAALGRTKIQVWTTGGLALGYFAFVPNDPPVLVGATLVQNGTVHKWWTAGTPYRTAFLLMNLTGQTLPLVGYDVLAYDLLLPFPQTSPIGVEEIAAAVNGLPVGLTVWMQFATLDPPGNDIGTLKVSNLLPVTVTG